MHAHNITTAGMHNSYAHFSNDAHGESASCVFSMYMLTKKRRVSLEVENLEQAVGLKRISIFGSCLISLKYVSMCIALFGACLSPIIGSFQECWRASLSMHIQTKNRVDQAA